MHGPMGRFYKTQDTQSIYCDRCFRIEIQLSAFSFGGEWLFLLNLSSIAFRLLHFTLCFWRRQIISIAND